MVDIYLWCICNFMVLKFRKGRVGCLILYTKTCKFEWYNFHIDSYFNNGYKKISVNCEKKWGLPLTKSHINYKEIVMNCFITTIDQHSWITWQYSFLELIMKHFEGLSLWLQILLEDVHLEGGVVFEVLASPWQHYLNLWPLQYDEPRMCSLYREHLSVHGQRFPSPFRNVYWCHSYKQQFFLPESTSSVLFSASDIQV